MEVLWTQYKNTGNVCVLQKCIFLFSSSNRILFHNTKTNKYDTYLADGRLDNGDGVQCTAAHQTVPIFAFAEMVTKSRLIVKQYPSFQTVAMLFTPVHKSYLSVCFSETDHLIALTGIATFTLEIWNWRTSQLLGTKQTNLASIEQTLSCTGYNHVFVLQFAENLNRLKVWNLHFCVDILKVTELDFNHSERSITGYASHQDSIIIYDADGNIHLVSIFKKTHQQIDRGRPIKAIAVLETGFVCSTSDEIILYTKSDNEDTPYRKVASISVQSQYCKIFPVNESQMYAISIKGEWSLISLTPELSVSKVFTNNRLFKFQVIFEDSLIIISDDNVIEIWCIEERKLVKSFNDCPQLSITCIKVHSSKNYLIIGTSDSKILIYYLINLEIHLLQELFLSDTAIASVCYTANYIICSDANGFHFIVDATNLQVLTYISHSERVLQMIVLEKHVNVVKFYFFDQTEDNRFCTNKLSMVEYFVLKNTTKATSIDLPFSIGTVAYSPKHNKFIVNPLLTKELKILSIGGISNTHETEIQTLTFKSNIKHLKVKVAGEGLIVYGLDGSLTYLNLNGEPLSSVVISHRLSGGTRKVLQSPTSKYFLVTDSAQNLTCLKTNIHQAPTTNIKRMPSIVVPQSVHRPKISWFESRHHTNLQSEMQDNKQICQEMIAKMDIIQRDVQNLLDLNEKKLPDEQLPIQRFNLNEAHLALLHQDTQSTDLDSKQIMAQLIAKEKVVQQWLISNCWDVMKVKNTLIKGIFSDFQVENFALLSDEPETLGCLFRIEQMFKIEQLTNSDVFLPFAAPLDTNQLEMVLSQEPRCCSPEAIVRSSKYSIDSGSTTANFITPTYDRFSQLEVVSFNQCHMEELLGRHDVLSLKIYFNEKFNELQEVKSMEMVSISAKNERLRVIQSELNDLAQLGNKRTVYKDEIVDPQFCAQEKPELVILVHDEEMTCRPFQEIKNRTQQSDEITEEGVIQELFNSAFRDNCLQKMMDGVLEIRWEDEIKKIPAVPVALEARKDLRDYDEHDFRAVKEYEDKLHFLGSERQKYKQLLQTDKNRLLSELDIIIRSFNGQLQKLNDLKIDVEMAINQENLKLLRNRDFNRMRILYVGKENAIKRLVLCIKKDIGSLTNALHDIDKKSQEFKIVLENMETRDRQMDKQFKNNFAELSSHAIVDQAYKFFKRRSRWVPKIQTTPAILNDMARRLSTRDPEPSGPPLHDECLEFLNILEQHDEVTNCPNIMDERLWDLLCRMRRLKIESELKVRALTAQLIEAQHGEQALSKEIAHKKMTLVALDKQMAEVREKKQVNMVNRTAQFVVKRGQIEVPLTGRLSDYEDVILIAKAEVDEINKTIRVVGSKKLVAMNNAAIFRRRVLQKEWEHEVLKLKIKDMRGFVKIVEKCKITKDVLRWLTRKQMGRSDDVSQVALNREIDRIIAGFELELSQVESEYKTLCRKIQGQQANNQKLDKEIATLNLDVQEHQKLHDPELAESIVLGKNNRLHAISERTRLMRRIQKQHSQIVESRLLLELQRLRTYPTLNEYR